MDLLKYVCLRIIKVEKEVYNMTPTEQKKYDARLKRLQDALALKEPDRVPIDITGGCYMIQRLGYTMAE